MTLDDVFKNKNEFEQYWLKTYQAACKNGTMLDVNFIAEVQKRYKKEGMKVVISEEEYEKFLMILYNGD